MVQKTMIYKSLVPPPAKTRISATLLTMALTGCVVAAAASGDNTSRPKPLIGINMDVGDHATTNTRLSLHSSFVDAVTSAGGIPIILPPLLDESDVARQTHLIDGFIFIGGRDINPARYGQEPHPAHNQVNFRRENYDLTLMKKALGMDKPVLGICLGMQEMNIISGGKMIQDIPTQTSGTLNHRPGGRGIVHEIEIVEQTRLHDLMGTTSLGVNSIHHQACDAVATGVVVSARAPDGIIEGIELPHKRFAVGLQWHPEYLVPEDSRYLAVFRGLVEAAASAREQNNQAQEARDKSSVSGTTSETAGPRKRATRERRTRRSERKEARPALRRVAR